MANAKTPQTQWLTIPDLMEVLGLNQSQVRRLIEDNVLAATRVDGVLKVPADFIHDGEPLPALQGTIVLLRDVGFDGDELVQWLITEEESLTVSPVDALKAGRKAEVRRIAQALL
ncbi:Rv2175c family DNA-binding protein [uncultured Aurantimicrobium sp.]|uniref:Rv2175c family DNA-binding protein n=1 Tax=uncultured Aurantimicrobium sp. TaxID=1705357 RepID=UPI0034225E8F